MSRAEVDLAWHRRRYSNEIISRPRLGNLSTRLFLYGQRTKRTKLSQAGGDISGNLGFTYDTQSDETAIVGYLRVWILRQSRWSLMFDVVSR